MELIIESSYGPTARRVDQLFIAIDSEVNNNCILVYNISLKYQIQKFLQPPECAEIRHFTPEAKMTPPEACCASAVNSCPLLLPLHSISFISCRNLRRMR